MRSHGFLALCVFAVANVAVAFTSPAPVGVPAPLGSSSPVPSASKQPMVIELFTSEGCSSCPPADSFLKKLAEQQPFQNLEIIALEEHVDYWNHDGWFDPFSSPEFTGRQQDYASHFPKGGGTYTPQMIIDGRTQLVGSHVQEALENIRSAASQPLAPLQLTPTGEPSANTRTYELRLVVQPAAHPSSRLDLWIAITEKGLHSNVNAGENSGHTLEHAPVVRYLHKQQSLSLPLSSPITLTVRLDKKWTLANLTTVAFLADPHSHQIQAAGSSPVTP
jgi:hypothetical protein